MDYKVLLVEDNQDYVDLLYMALNGLPNNPYVFTTVKTLEEALNSLEEDIFDAVLLDLNLPKSRGFETFSSVYAKAINVPIVVMTAIDDKELALTLVKEGAQDYLVKGSLDVDLVDRSLQFAIERHTTLAHLRHLSMIDELTNLLNRRGFFSLALQHLKIATRSKRDMLMLYIDVDDLKKVNDQHGHQAGDKLLEKVASVLKSTFRSSDIVTRFGGDEFVVLAIDTPESDAEMLKQRLVENLNKDVDVKDFGPISLSIGSARFKPGSPISLNELIKHADEDMYEQKRIANEAEV